MRLVISNSNDIIDSYNALLFTVVITMKSRISRVYRHHIDKRVTTYVLSKQGKSINKGLANPKVTHYTQGNVQAYHQGLLPHQWHVIAKQSALLVEASLESFRITFSRLLSRKSIKSNWYLAIRPRTHVLLRKHKMPSGGAVDRVSMGMRLAYGSPFARAAKIREKQLLMSLNCNDNVDKAYVRECLRKALSKVAIAFKIVFRS